MEKIAIKFSVDTKYGTYNDTLYVMADTPSNSIEELKQKRVDNWIYHIEHADELAIPKSSQVQRYINLFATNGINFIHKKSKDASKDISIIETFTSDTLYCLECPDFVFMGQSADIEQVNQDYCIKNNIEIVKNKFLGGSFLCEKDKNILIGLITHNEFSEDMFRCFLMNILKDLSIPNITMRSNDILSNEKQIGMTSPTVRFDNGMYCVGGQITFGVDFNKVEACLSFSKSKWIDKGGVTSIRDWIQPIDAIKTLSIKDFIATLKQTFEDKFKIKLIEEKVGN